MFLRCAQPTILTRSPPKGKQPFSAFVGTIWDIFLSHVPRLQCPCQAVGATAGTGLAGLCNLIISILGLPQEMWPKVEVCQVSGPLEWESLNGQILQWLWKLSEIIHKYPALSSFPAELYSDTLGKQNLVQIQNLLILAVFFFSVADDQENSGFTHFANTAPFELLWMASACSVFEIDLDYLWCKNVNKMEALPTWKLMINLTMIMLELLSVETIFPRLWVIKLFICAKYNSMYYKITVTEKWHIIFQKIESVSRKSILLFFSQPPMIFPMLLPH